MTIENYRYSDVFIHIFVWIICKNTTIKYGKRPQQIFETQYNAAYSLLRKRMTHRTKPVPSTLWKFRNDTPLTNAKSTDSVNIMR